MNRRELFPQFGEMDEHTRKRLKDSIAERGYDPALGMPVLDEDGNVIDGKHRLAIAEELGIEIPVEVRAGLSETEKFDHAYDANELRRQMPISDRRTVQRDYIERHSDKSNRQLAKELGVAPNTVRAARQEMELVGRIDHQAPRVNQHEEVRQERRRPDEGDQINASNHRGETSFRFTYFYQAPSEAVRARGQLMYPRESEGRTWSIVPGNPTAKVALTTRAPKTEEEWGAICDEIRDRIFRAGLEQAPLTMDQEFMSWR